MTPEEHAKGEEFVRFVTINAENKETDFDSEKVGYPRMVREPFASDAEYNFNTRKLGMSNKGHTKMMLTEDGQEKFNHEEKLEIIEFLKTL